MTSDSGEMRKNVKSAVSVQLSVFKLVDSTEKKFHAGYPAKDINELKQLREQCDSESLLVSLTACQGLVQLVRANVLPLTNTVSALLASIFSVKHLAGVVSAVAELLTLELRGQLSSEGVYSSPYDGKTTPHPLVTVLRRRPLAWPDVLNQITAVCCHADKRVCDNSLALVRPVLAYIVTEINDVPAAGRLQAFQIVIQYFSDSPFLIDTFASCLCWEESLASESVHAVLSLSQWAVSIKHGQMVSLSCLALCSLLPRLLRAGLSPRPALISLISLAPAASLTHSTMLAVIAAAVPTCPAIYLDHLLVFVSELLTAGQCSQDCAWMCVSGLLPWLASTAPVPPNVSATASRIVGQASSASVVCSAAPLISDRAVAAVVSADECLTRALQLARLSERLQDGAGCAQWLAQVGEITSDQVYHFCCALLLSGGRGSQEVRLAALRAVVKAKAPSGPCHTLTLLLYQLAREKDPHVQLALMQALPATAVDKTNVVGVLATLEALRRSGHPRLELLAVDLYSQLWLSQPRCYPQLMSVLNQPDSHYADPSLARLLHANICCVICDTEPEKHGKEVVLKVSEVLGRAGGLKEAAAAALAIRALIPLCRHDVVDVFSIWRSLAPKFSRDKRAAVIGSLCELVSVAAVQKAGSADAEDARGQMIRWLWNLVAGGTGAGKQPEAVKSALKALSEFRVDQMNLKMLPECFRKDLKLPPELAKTPVDAARKPEDVLDYIPGECWANFLQYVGTEEAALTVSCWIRMEIASFKPSFYQVDRAEPTSYDHLPRSSVVRGITARLQQQCKAGGGAALAHLCLASLVQPTPRPLPSLGWSFLSALTDPAVRDDVTRLAAKQSQISPTARVITERAIDGAGADKSKIEFLYSILVDLGRGIPPSILRPFLERTLQTALIEKEKEHFSTIIQHVERTLKEGKIHDANKNLLNQLVKGLWDLVDLENELAPLLMSCVGQLPVSVVEAACSTTLMWEVTPAQIRKAFRLRARMALAPDTEEPLNWINEIVEVAAADIAEQQLALELITEVITQLSSHPSAWSWLHQLMGQAHLSSVGNKGGLDFLVAVFVLCVDVMSNFSCVSGQSHDSESRALGFPQAVVSLVTRYGDTRTMMEWLTHMRNVESIPAEFAFQFQLAARNLSVIL